MRRFWGHLTSLYRDVESLAKRKQDGMMSKTRVSAINQVLGEVRDFLKDEASLKFLNILDEVTLPQNADALIFFGQYKSAMEDYSESTRTRIMGHGPGSRLKRK